MLIDWFTVVAQVINFLVLVWLLKRFLYKPLLKAIGEREKRIADQLRDAEEKEAAAQKEKTQYQQQNEAFTSQKAALLTAAGTDAAAERQRLLEKGTAEAEQLRARLMENMDKEQLLLKEAFARRIETEVFGITRKLLADLANANLEAEIVRVFIRRLDQLPADQQQTWQEALRSSTDPVLVRTALELAPGDRAALEQAWRKKFATGRLLSFEHKPDLVNGIELAINGYKLTWAVSDYLASLEKTITYGNAAGIAG